MRSELTLSRTLLDLFLPTRCAYCHRRTDGFRLCADCVADLPWNTPACRACALPLPDSASRVCRRCLRRAPVFDEAFAALRLTGPAQRAVHRLKYRAGLAEAPLLAGLMAAQLRQRDEALPDLLIPVPLHPWRLATRGYNQAALLAAALGADLGCQVAREAAVRTRWTADQIGQGAKARRRNLRGAFSVQGVRDRHVALVDDVMTTGATLEALARRCRRAGATRVQAWVAARAP